MANTNTPLSFDLEGGTGLKTSTHTVTGPYMNLVYKSGATVFSVIADPDDPINFEGATEASEHTPMVLSGVGATYIAVRLAWTGNGANRTLSNSPIVRFYGFYPIPLWLQTRGSALTPPIVENVTGHWAPLYDRANSNAFDITMASSAVASDIVIADDTTYRSYTKDIILDASGASKVLAFPQTAPTFSGAITMSAIQGRAISFS